MTFYDSSARALQVTPKVVDIRLSLEVGTGGFPVLEARLTNFGKNCFGLMDFDYLRPDSKFVIWLMRNAAPVPLTNYGQHVQQRTEYNGDWAGGGPSTWLEPGESKSFKVELKKLFQIESSGDYTVVVEDGPIGGNDQFDRAAHAAKTSFVLPGDN